MRGSNCKQLNHGIEMNRTWGLALLHIRILSAHHSQQFPGLMYLNASVGLLGDTLWWIGSSVSSMEASRPMLTWAAFYRLNVLGFQVEGTSIWPSMPQKRHWCTSYWVTWNQTTLGGFPGQYMNKVSHFVWWGCLRSLSPEYAQEARESCLHMQLCSTQLLRNTGGQPCMMSFWSIWIHIAWIAWHCLLSTAWTACIFASKRLEYAGSHKKAAVGAGKLMHGLHEFRNWRVPRSKGLDLYKCLSTCGTLVLTGCFWTAWTSCLRMSCGWPWSPNSPMNQGLEHHESAKMYWAYEIRVLRFPCDGAANPTVYSITYIIIVIIYLWINTYITCIHVAYLWLRYLYTPLSLLRFVVHRWV